VQVKPFRYEEAPSVFNIEIAWAMNEMFCLVLDFILVLIVSIGWTIASIRVPAKDPTRACFRWLGGVGIGVVAFRLESIIYSTFSKMSDVILGCESK
jgi:hypothetical protein